MVCKTLWVGVVMLSIYSSSVPDYSDCSQSHECQGYLYGVPTKFKTRGLNVLEAQKIANNMGEDATVILADSGIYDTHHYDLPQPHLTIKDNINWHTTAVAGVISGRLNFSGVTGIVAKARVATADVNAIPHILDYLRQGDVINCSVVGDSTLPGVGPRGVPWFDQPGYWEDFTSYLIKVLGVHVVNSAGNNNANYDKERAAWRSGWRATQDTGIILVGGVDPSNGEKSSFSNYGKRIHLTAWGRNVVSTTNDGKFKVDWAGTSLTSPQIAGCVALLQSISRAKGLGNVEPVRMRQILIDSGDEFLYETPERAKRISWLPDMVKAIGLLHPSLGPVLESGQTILFE